MRIPIALYLLALAARLLLIIDFPAPAYPDSYYYVDVARSLAAGHGFNVDFIWIFAEVGGKLPAVPILPIPSNAHWMPLASIVQVPFMWLLGPTPFASALPFAIIGSLAAPLAWAIGRDAGVRPSIAVGAGILTAIPALSLPFMAQPDNFSLYQPLVAGALWMAARGLRGHARSFALGGLLVGLATLSRNDGLLVGATFGLAFLWDRVRALRSGGERRPAIPVWAAVACFGLFLLIMAPWWWRQLEVFGQLSPSAASGKVLYIRSIDEWNSITTPATLDWLLGQGIGPLLISRILGFVAAVGIFVTLVGAGLLAPFMVIGGWVRRRSVDFGPFLTYTAILFAFSGLVSAIHVPGGTFIHSAAALAPHAYLLALEGIVVAVAWLAARRRRWDREVAIRFFTYAAIGFAILAAVAGSLGVHATWRQQQNERLAVSAALDLAGVTGDARLMSIDAAGYDYYTGRGGVVSPNDPIETIHQVATAYRIEWLIVERANSVPALGPVFSGENRPAWIGPRLVAIPGPDGQTAVAIYPICASATDRRCTITAGAGESEWAAIAAGMTRPAIAPTGTRP